MKFWSDWVIANGLAELVGLGSVAVLGYALIYNIGDPQGVVAIFVAGAFVLLGALEGYAVGFAQSRVLRKHGITIPGWLGATVVGAVVAWAVGMIPSTIINFVQPGTSEAPPPEISQVLRLAFAAAMGVVAGPILAYFQWRTLRRQVSQGALWWLPANAVAWAFGMPIVFWGIHLVVTTGSPLMAVGLASISLLLAGIVVGAVHGAVLIRILKGRASE